MRPRIMVHYVVNGDAKHGTTLCGLPVRASMGVIATTPSHIRYVSCPECLRLLRKESSSDEKDPSPSKS
jgi:hypothetical protein